MLSPKPLNLPPYSAFRSGWLCFVGLNLAGLSRTAHRRWAHQREHATVPRRSLLRGSGIPPNSYSRPLRSNKRCVCAILPGVMGVHVEAWEPGEHSYSLCCACCKLQRFMEWDRKVCRFYAVFDDLKTPQFERRPGGHQKSYQQHAATYIACWEAVRDLVFPCG